jgi:hypothetical protein
VTTSEYLLLYVFFFFLVVVFAIGDWRMANGGSGEWSLDFMACLFGYTILPRYLVTIATEVNAGTPPRQLPLRALSEYT